MQLASKMMSEMEEQDQVPWEVVPPEPGMVDSAEMTDCERKWYRMAIILRMVELHATTGAIIRAQEVIRERKIEEARKAYEDIAGEPMPKTKMKAKAPGKINDPRMWDKSRPLKKGKPFSRSLAGPFAKTPETCPHTEETLEFRGNAYQSWITCTICGARWSPVPKAVGTPTDPSGYPPPGSVGILSISAAAAANLPEGFHAIKAKDLKVGDKVVMGQPVKKRSSEDVLMRGLSPMAQQAYQLYQKILVDVPGSTHEQAIQELMRKADGQEEIKAIMDMSTFNADD